MTKIGVWRPWAVLQYKNRMLRLSDLLILGALAFLFGCQSASPEVREFEGAYPVSRAANGQVRTFDLIAKETELPLVDGTSLRVWAYNGQVPGPTLRVRLGERLRVHFTNQLPQATTIHWHGVRVPNDMDGVPHATQPPIQPGESFTYEFTPKDAGTFWFHPHIRSSEQVERGLYGVLIVEDEKPLPYTQDVVWVIDDWLLDETRQVLPRFNTRHDLAHDGRWGNAITVNGRTDTELKVKGGDRIRLRLLNSSNGRVYAPDFSGLDTNIIAVDGLYLREPIPLQGFEMAPGNRVDIDIVVREAVSRVFPVVDYFRPRRPNQLASIVVDDVGPAAPAFPSPARARVPAWREGLMVPVTKEFRLNARQGGEYGIEWTLNDEAFAGHDHAHAALTLKRGAFARVRFVNDSFRLHPMHLHGMFFKVLARDGVRVDEPFFRDTVLIHPKETVDIGLVPLDEGDWMMHCHILEHAEAGMMTMLEVRS
jgi:FtsP/CotA-like multicopper oxidase with cupredoxin domain